MMDGQASPSLEVFHERICSVCVSQLLPALDLYRERSMGGFRVLPSVHLPQVRKTKTPDDNPNSGVLVPQTATRQFVTAWQIVSAARQLERDGPVGVCVALEGGVICADLRPHTARFLLPTMEALVRARHAAAAAAPLWALILACACSKSSCAPKCPVDPTRSCRRR
jgi:hypothetical protein